MENEKVDTKVSGMLSNMTTKIYCLGGSVYDSVGRTDERVGWKSGELYSGAVEVTWRAKGAVEPAES